MAKAISLRNSFSSNSILTISKGNRSWNSRLILAPPDSSMVLICADPEPSMVRSKSDCSCWIILQKMIALRRKKSCEWRFWKNVKRSGTKTRSVRKLSRSKQLFKLQDAVKQALSKRGRVICWLVRKSELRCYCFIHTCINASLKSFSSWAKWCKP